MKSQDYKQILKYAFENIGSFGQVINQLGLEKLDELRSHHEKYKRECDKLSIYAHQDKSDLIKYQNWIMEFCEENEINVIFTRKETLEYKKSFYAYYNYKGMYFTDLIVFNGKKS